MPIITLDDYIGATKQIISWTKYSRTTVANAWFSMFDIAGNPGAGVLPGTSTTQGVVPTDLTPGCPIITFTSGLGYLGTVSFGSTASCRFRLADMLWKGGAYAYNSGTTTVTSPPSYSSRVPGGTDFTGLQIWVEVATSFVGGSTWHVECTYTNQSGVTGKTTATMSGTTAANLTIGRMHMLPLAPGDSGVQKIESVIVTPGAATVGTFNVLVIRPLWDGRVIFSNHGDSHGIDRTGMPLVFNDSALITMVNSDTTTSGGPDILYQIASA